MTLLKITFFLFIILLTFKTSFIYSQELPSFIDEPQRNKYKNESIGLEFWYPITWKIDSDSSNLNYCNPLCTIVLQNNEEKSTIIPIVVKNTSFLIEKCECTTFVDMIKFQYNQSFRLLDIKSLNDNQTSLTNGLKAWQLEYTEADATKNYVIWFLLDDFFYEINYHSDRNHYSTYLPHLIDLLNSIKFFTANPDASSIQKQVLPSFLKESCYDFIFQGENETGHTITKTSDCYLSKDVCNQVLSDLIYRHIDQYVVNDC